MIAHFDETGVSGGAERITAVAGYLFSGAGASGFREMFDEQVEPLLPPDPARGGERLFHAAQCALGYRPFDQVSESDRVEIIRRLDTLHAEVAALRR